MAAPHKDRVITIYVGEGIKAKLQNYCDQHKPRPLRVSRFVSGLIIKALKRAEIASVMRAA